jgi:hypothetical protein
MVVLLAGASACTSKGPAPVDDAPAPTTVVEPQPTSDPKPEPPGEVKSSTWDVVRVDPEGRETHLGRVRVDDSPPFRATFVDGGDELRTLVDAANALPDFTYNDGSPVVRASDPRWFDFLRREWIGQTHGLVLRVASESTAVSRYRLLVVDDGEHVSLATLEMNDMGYLRVLDGPAEHRERVRTLIDASNAQDSQSIEIPPPDGEIGQWAKAIRRGTPEFFVMLRHALYGQHDALLIAEARAMQQAVQQPQAVTVLENRGLRVRVPAGLSSTDVAYPTIVSLSGPPGGPLGVLVIEYDDMPDTDAALLARVEALHGHDPHFEAGPAIEVDIGGQRWRAATCRTGSSLGRATHLIIAWSPTLDLVRDGERGDDGYLVALTLGGEVEAQALLDHPLLGSVIDSLP